MKSLLGKILTAEPRDFYSDAQVGLCTFDLELRFIHVNRWLAVVHGASIEQHLGRRIADVNSDIAFDLSPRLKSVLATGESTSAVTGMLDGTQVSGQIRNFQYVCSPLKNDAGAIEGIICVVEEFTDRIHRSFERQNRESGFINMVSGIPAGFAYFDADARFTFANQYYGSMIGVDPADLTGMHLGEVLGPRGYKVAQKFVERALRGEKVSFKNELKAADGGIRYIEVSYVPDESVDGSVNGFLAMVQDMTQHRRAEIALQKANDALTERVNQRTAELESFDRALRSEVAERKNAFDQFLAFLEAMPDPTIVVDEAGKIDLANSRIQSVLGYSPEELRGKNVELLVPKESQMAHVSHRHGYGKTPTPRMMGVGPELFAICKDGRKLPVEVSLTPADIAGKSLVIAHIRDMTAEHEARDREVSLSARLLHAQEDERSRIARELHDDFSQRLALLAINLGRLTESGNRINDAGSQILGSEISALQESANEISFDINRLSHQLHPPILDHIGLAAAVSNLSDEFTTLHDVNVKVEHAGETADISKDASLCLYRIAQEALWNVVRHSEASEAVVSIDFGPSETRLVVRDNGKGFDQAAAESGEGLGLISMRERLLLVDGELEIRQIAPNGTEIVAIVPARWGHAQDRRQA